jgi:hypothetical protein
MAAGAPRSLRTAQLTSGRVSVLPVVRFAISMIPSRAQPQYSWFQTPQFASPARPQAKSGLTTNCQNRQEMPGFIGALGGIRTPDPQIRSLMLREHALPAISPPRRAAVADAAG